MRDCKNMKNELSILELGSSWEILEDYFKKYGDGKFFDWVRYVISKKSFVTIIIYLKYLAQLIKVCVSSNKGDSQ